MPIDRPLLFVRIALVLLLGSLTACANSPFGKSLEESLSADPQLQQTPQPTATPSPTPKDTVELPADFPTEIPRYEAATLQKVEEDATAEYPVVTQWTSPDPSNAIAAFYQQQLAENGWEISETPSPGQTQTTIAQRENLRIKVTIAPPSDGTDTSLEIAYRNDAIASTPSPTPTATPSPVSTPSGTPTQFSDLQTVAEPLRTYIQDLAKLGILTPATAQSNAFVPDNPLKRREYARWLFAAHNRIYADTPSKQLRPATASNTPSFGDVPTTDPDFDTIQGLAEAGIIPSALSGEATAVKFRPDDPLSREEAIAWKVPLDWRQALPNATLQSITETWGFQDTAQIDPKVLRALLADFQSGERANIRRAFGYTTLFQPKKAVTRAEGAAILWYFGNANTGKSAKDALDSKPNPPQS
ncbi:MAG TPA: S-layer homology domain-containing protein [Oscillatoriales cyanobacterium M59_W2019_021]|nr:MAG: S-layer homology domain-containing protein [Cyanobacteria bacterium J055]HIK32217.1 S-layer homology domain-containing protein [Oscillatoriales cyanobacterium M4454_W2019_049]HIK50895.1 S-layer homology domain-containing protein [Oscillatoriales cyanobacterium M59_W2019_021]